jgi:transposase
MDMTLQTFLQTTSDVREYQRALAVQFALRGDPYATIRAVLPVSKAFISKWKQLYDERGTDGLRVAYRGSKGYLTAAQRVDVLAWIAAQPTCDLAQLHAYVTDTYAVTYQSNQSYYALLREAGLRWKKVQASNPKKTRHRWLPNTPK